MKKRVVVCAAAVLCLTLGLFALAGCGSGSTDASDIQGEWKVQNSTVTVVFTDTKFKTVATTFDYTLDTSSKKITFSYQEQSGTGTYSFSDDKKELTLNEDDGNGGTKTTVFDKVSDDTSTEPSANAK